MLAIRIRKANMTIFIQPKSLSLVETVKTMTIVIWLKNIRPNH